MLKQNKGKLILSSVLILLPAFFGVILWNLLPERMTTHLDPFGMVWGSGSRWAVVFVIPLVLLALHWLGMWWTARDHRHREQDKKVMGMIFWIMPVISLWANGMLYAVALGLSVNLMILVCVLLGVIFLVTGNYMPKCRRNRTVGIKIKWTLANEENWVATHRFAGKIWVICGFLFLFSAFLPSSFLPWVMIAVIALAIVPIAVYSPLYARKQIREGRAAKEDFRETKSKTAKVVGIVMSSVILIFAGMIMFTGNVEILYHEMSLEAEADYFGDLHLSYDAIKGIEYRENFDKGRRISGFGTPRLSLGSFENEEFDVYTIYAYTNCDAAVVLYVEGDRVVVLSGKDEIGTKAIYEEILKRME